MDQTATLAVHRSVVVEAPPDRAFATFTDGFATWWPMESHHTGPVDAETAVIEPREGGRWYERGVDGSEEDWGRVLVWEPPSRLVLAWQLSSEFRYDPSFLTEVEVRFTPEDGGTRVELEHRGFERLGEGAEALRAPVDSEGGWTGLLARYADAAGG